LIRTTVSDAQARGEGLALTITEFVTGTLYLGLGRYDAALTAVGPAERYPEEGAAIWALIELIEAAVRSGQPQLAGAALERVTETTRASGTAWALATEARCRALLSEGDAVETDDLYQRAIEHSGSTSLRVHLARAHLLYGEWLRRERRRLEAREQLRTAFEMFNAMGIEAFAGRAERELLATGERVRKRSVETRDKLTAQETQIARLAGEGLSNAEIGARLFISQHTVAYHLRKVFAKLDISSRTKLLRAQSVLRWAASPTLPARDLRAATFQARWHPPAGANWLELPPTVPQSLEASVNSAGCDQDSDRLRMYSSGSASSGQNRQSEIGPYSE
jgi:DNA-binding CsgD family transcriptional regulator